MKSKLLFGLAILGIVSCAAQNHIRKNTYADSLTMALQNFAKTSKIPGFSVVVVDEKGLLYSKGFGEADIQSKKPFTVNTIHQVASISKTFMAFSIMKLIEEGKLNLDDPINSVLPFKIVNPHFPNTPITIRHIVTHTSTITDFFNPYNVGEADAWLVKDVNPNDYPESDYMRSNISFYKTGKPISLQETIRKFTQPNAKWYSDSTFLKYQPGTHYQYSNLGAAIAALIVETKSGMSFTDYTKKYIFMPLKMKNTGWKFEGLNEKLFSKIYKIDNETKPPKLIDYPQRYSAVYPSGGLLTTAADMSNYLHEMIKGVAGKGKLLKADSYQMLFSPQAPKNVIIDEDSTGKTNMGVFWFLVSNERASHKGGNDGIYSVIYLNKKTKRGAFAHCNLRDDGFGDLYEIVKEYEKKMDVQ